jgi:hypothetical protein
MPEENTLRGIRGEDEMGGSIGMNWLRRDERNAVVDWKLGRNWGKKKTAEHRRITFCECRQKKTRKVGTFSMFKKDEQE